MRADADFMVFVAARWPGLVKEVVLLGVPPEDAADATADALSRCRRGWERTSREGDVEALVREELLAAVGRRARTDQAGREQAARELLVLAPPTLEELRHQESRRNRAVLKRAALVAVPLLLVGVGAGAYLASEDPGPSRPHDDTLGNAAVAREENPAPGVVWYADGQLHLAHTVLAIQGLRDMTRVGDGAVYGDDQGRVVYVADDGARDVLGHKDADQPVAASDENGWAAWVETRGDQPAIVVAEAETGNKLLTFPVESETRVVAVDGDAVYFQENQDAYYLVTRPPPGAVTVVPSSVLDVRSRTRVFQADETHIRVVQPLFDSELDLPGQGAVLSPDGTLVVTTQPGTDTPAVFDARSGIGVPSGLAEGDQVVAFAPGDRQTIAYVVAPAAAGPVHDLELRTCELVARPEVPAGCSVRARIPATGASPVLAR